MYSTTRCLSRQSTNGLALLFASQAFLCTDSWSCRAPRRQGVAAGSKEVAQVASVSAQNDRAFAARTVDIRKPTEPCTLPRFSRVRRSGSFVFFSLASHSLIKASYSLIAASTCLTRLSRSVVSCLLQPQPSGTEPSAAPFDGRASNAINGNRLHVINPNIFMGPPYIIRR